MKINDVVLNEDSPLGSTNDYQKMMSFVKSSGISGLPQDQQIALALFRELERQKQRNDQLDAELDSAEQRIDVATQGGELQKQALGKHATELEKERGNIAQQQAAVGKLDQTYADREQASKRQLQDLSSKLEIIKSKPGVDPEVTSRLDKEISDLKKNGVGADKVKELEQSIADVQQMRHVDDDTMNDLISKVNAAQAATKELEKTKQIVGKDAEETAKLALDQVEQLKQQLAHIKELEQTVAALNPLVTDVLAPKIQRLETDSLDTDATIGELEQTIEKLGTAISGKQAAASPTASAQMVRPALQQVKPNPPQIAQQLVRSGDLRAIAEGQMLKAIRWATGKTK